MAEKQKRDVFGKAKEMIGGIGNRAKKSDKSKFVHVSGTSIKLLLPDGYELLKLKKQKKNSEKQEDAVYRKTGASSENTVQIMSVRPEEAMDPDDLQGLIDNIHDCLSDKQGIIEARNGISERGYRYIYSIVKTLAEEPFGGVRYFLHADIYSEDDIIDIRADFKEIGMSGEREAACLELARRAGLADMSSDGIRGWTEDPYDPEYKKGCLKNLAEKEGLDVLFPENPLSQAREFLLAVLHDELVMDTQEEIREQSGEEERELSILFEDECRRVTRHVTAEDPETVSIDGEEADSESAETGEGEEIRKKRDKLDDQLKAAVTDYNAAYTDLNDHGTKLYNQRERSIDLLGNVENLINSIANHPKEFDADIADIRMKKQDFREVCEFAKEELEAAKKSALGAGAGVAGGMAVASLAPSAAMWIATTFGTASTGTAISALSGAAAQSAALAWLGGGALAAGGGGMAAGQAFLALAGPVGWSIAGATLLTSIVLFANKKIKLDKEKREEIESVKRNTEQLKETDVKLDGLLKKTTEMRERLSEQYTQAMRYFGRDFLDIPEEDKMLLGAIVNNAKALALSLGEGV